MKNPFKRKKNPEPEKAAPQESKPRQIGIHVFAIPDHEFQPGNLYQVTEDGGNLEVIEPPWKVFERLNMRLTIEYDPHVDYEGRTWYYMTFVPEYHYRGQSFGPDATKVVKEIGLEFPNRACPETSRVEVKEDGKVVWQNPYWPEAGEIEKVVQETRRQVCEIIRDYGRVRTINQVMGEKKK